MPRKAGLLCALTCLVGMLFYAAELRFSTAGALVQAVEYISSHLHDVSTPFLVFHSLQV